MPRPTLAQLQQAPSILPAVQADVNELLGVLVAGENPDGSAFSLPVDGYVESAARSGYAFKSSTARMALTAAGNVRATIANPAGSGRRLLLHRMTGLATGIAWARMYVNPTIGLPAGVRPVNNAFIGHPVTPVAEMRADTNLTTALGGGNDSGLDVGIPNGTRWTLELEPMIVPAGVTVGVNVPFAGAADAVMTAYWVEEPI